MKNNKSIILFILLYIMQILRIITIMMLLTYACSVSEELVGVKYIDCPDNTHFVFTNHAAPDIKNRGVCIKNRIHDCTDYDVETGRCIQCGFFHTLKNNTRNMASPCIRLKWEYYALICVFLSCILFVMFCLCFGWSCPCLNAKEDLGTSKDMRNMEKIKLIEY